MLYPYFLIGYKINEKESCPDRQLHFKNRDLKLKKTILQIPSKLLLGTNLVCKKKNNYYFLNFN